MDRQELQNYLNMKFQGRDSFLETIMYPIFGEDKFLNAWDIDVLEGDELIGLAQRTGVESAIKYGTFDLPHNTIDIFEVTVSDRVQMQHNRVGIQQIIRRIMDTYSSAFIIFHYDSSDVWDWRFSFCQKDDKNFTEAKRYTFLLGPGQSCRTAAENFHKLIELNGKVKRDDIVNAFSVEALSDMFFKEYKKNYEDIIEFITGKRMVKVANKWEEQVTGNPCREIMQEFSVFPDAEKAVRDYVKKLMGRLVFIQFLQKKGWMGCSAGEAWNDGDKEFIQNLFTNSQYKNTFVDDVLEPLFDDINTKRDGDLVSDVRVGKNIKVPYLNGGLFEHDDYDNTTFSLPAKYMKQMLDFFASYNFTIDENDPDDAEIGVDPEMLGRIFENLLEDNKDKGAFYTPKEIVQYMCRESLIAYLQTDIEDETTKNTIRQFVTTYNAELLSKELSDSIDKKLKDVKICDPAIGSGAFPMGLLRELYACRKSIEGISQEIAVKIKTDIIQDNIYGVDIEKGAVDIARLRFWLALIVDEETPHALPNMDFKIMQGNSLLERYEGVELSGMSLNEQVKKKSKAKKEKAWQPSLAFDEQGALDNIQNAVREYYDTDNHDRKSKLRNIINANVKSYIRNLKGCTPDIEKKIENLPIPNNQFFLWHIYFKEVFDKGGFDIVIANPPYIDSESMTNQGMGNMREFLKKKYVCLEGNWDMYMAFLEFSLSIAKTVTFITPDKWLSKPFGKKFRAIRMRDRMSLITRAGSKVFENATVDAIITLYTKSSSNLSVNEFVANNNIAQIVNKGTFSIKDLQDPYIIDYLFADNIDVIIKMDSQNGKIIDLAECEGACATSDAYKLQPLVRDIIQPSDETDYKIINTGTISKYYNRWGLSPMKYLGNTYLHPTVDKKGFESIFGATYIKRAKRPKVIFKGLNLLDVCLDEFGHILPAKTTNVICSEDVKLLKFLCGLLNSKLIFYYIKLKYSSSSYCGGITFTKDMINYLPVNTNADRTPLVKLVEKILSEKKNAPLSNTSKIESEIDQLVYKLYGLTPDEIALVEASSK